MVYEESNPNPQEFENRFYTIFALLLSVALFFAKDSPIAFGRYYSPSLGFFAVIIASYAMHLKSLRQLANMKCGSESKYIHFCFNCS